MGRAQSLMAEFSQRGVEQVHALVQALVEGDPSEVKRVAANDVAIAQLELARIRTTRAASFAHINVGCDDTESLKRLAALDRYERIAYAKRRKAGKML